MLKFFFALALVAFATGEMKNFTGYQVFRVTPTNEEQTSLLYNFYEFSDAYNFWNGPTTLPNATADLMVAPNNVSNFKEIMNTSGTPYTTLIEDVQILIEAENPSVNSTRGKRQLPSVFDWTRYHTLNEINVYLRYVTRRHRDKAQVIISGRSYEGRYIKGVKLSFKSNNSAIFIEGGMHGREWISPAVATYIINELLTSEDPDIRELAENNDWYIFPVVNPDGYVYTHTHDRLWLKTRKLYTSMCNGADPNRNWRYKWNQGGSSSNPCSDSHAGSGAFSEIETRTLSNFIASISGNLHAYISFHSYGQYLLFPYGHTAEHLDNYDVMLRIGTKAIQALYKRFSTEYVTGNTGEKSYISTGSSVDWVKRHLHIPLVYTYKLRDKGTHGFMLPGYHIIPTGQEVLDSFVAMFKEARLRGIPSYEDEDEDEDEE